MRKILDGQRIPCDGGGRFDIKARMLLPKEVNEEGEEEDPRAELVMRLLEYKKLPADVGGT